MRENIDQKKLRIWTIFTQCCPGNFGFTELVDSWALNCKKNEHLYRYFSRIWPHLHGYIFYQAPFLALTAAEFKIQKAVLQYNDIPQTSCYFTKRWVLIQLVNSCFVKHLPVLASETYRCHKNSQGCVNVVFSTGEYSLCKIPPKLYKFSWLL